MKPYQISGSQRRPSIRLLSFSLPKLKNVRPTIFRAYDHFHLHRLSFYQYAEDQIHIPFVVSLIQDARRR